MPERARQERSKTRVYAKTLAEAEKKQGREKKAQAGDGEEERALAPVEAKLPSESREIWRRGDCPHCGKGLYSNLYYQQGKGYVIVWECDGAHQQPPTCDYRKEIWESSADGIK